MLAPPSAPHQPFPLDHYLPPYLEIGLYWGSSTVCPLWHCQHHLPLDAPSRSSWGKGSSNPLSSLELSMTSAANLPSETHPIIQGTVIPELQPLCSTGMGWPSHSALHTLLPGFSNSRLPLLLSQMGNRIWSSRSLGLTELVSQFFKS